MTASLSLDALFADPDHGGLRHLAGPRESLEFADVAVVAVEAELPESMADGLAVMLTSPPASSWRLDALLRRVADRGFTGLALPEPLNLDDGTRALAERLGLTVLAAHRPSALSRVAWSLTEGRDALTLTYVGKVARSIGYQAASLSDLLRHLASSIGHALALVDPEGVIDAVGEPPPDELLRSLRGSQRSRIATADGFGGVAVTVDSPSRSGLRLVIYGRGLSNVQLRALSTAADVAMPAVAARILIDEVHAVSDAARSRALLDDVIQVGGVVDEALDRRLRERGWRLGGHHLALHVVGRQRIDPIDLLRVVTAETSALGPSLRSVVRDDGVAVWVSWPEAPSVTELERARRDITLAHRRISAAYPVASGIGRPGDGAEGLVTSLDEARDAAALAARRPASGWIVTVDRLEHPQLLAAWTNPELFAPAARSLLAPLSDEERRTLGVYLDNESSLAATAETIGVHRNTVAPRIRRIEYRLGVDLTDPEVRLALHLAIRAAG